MIKVCRNCGASKPESDFPRYSGNRGLRPMCNDCFKSSEATKRKLRRENDPAVRARELETNKAYRARYSDGYRKHQLSKREKFASRYFSDLMFRCRQMVSAMQARAIKKGLEFNFTPETLFVIIHAQNFKCVVTGTKFDLSASKNYHRNPLAPSIDRKNSDQGYTLANIQIVASWYNMMKNEWSDDDVRSFIATAYHTMFGDH